VSLALTAVAIYPNRLPTPVKISFEMIDSMPASTVIPLRT